MMNAPDMDEVCDRTLMHRKAIFTLTERDLRRAGRSHGEGLPLFALVLAAATLGVPILVPLVLGLVAIRRRFRQDKALAQPATASRDDETYEIKQPGMYNRIPWSDYSKLLEGRHAFLFFRSDYSYQILPKRVLTEEQIADVREVIGSRQPTGN